MPKLDSALPAGTKPAGGKSSRPVKPSVPTPVVSSAASPGDASSKKPTPATAPPKELVTTTPQGSVYLEKSVTKNLGDFNSAKITVGISLPLYYTPEMLEEAKKTIAVLDEIVTKELDSQVEQLEAEV